MVSQMVSRLWGWFDARMPSVAQEWRKHAAEYYAPKNFNFWYFFGSLAMLVLVGICTHLGCSPVQKSSEAKGEMGADWAGGFLCPCHGSKFDLAGRVYKGAPAPVNLEVPPHTYLSDGAILIGEDKKGA